VSEFLTVNEVAEKLRLHPATIAKYVREGKILALKFGRVWRIREEELTKFLEKTEAEVKK